VSPCQFVHEVDGPCTAPAQFSAAYCSAHEGETLAAAVAMHQHPVGLVDVMVRGDRPMKIWHVEWVRYMRHHRASVDGQEFKAFTPWGAQRKARRYIKRHR
jgi:hypothetical protein